jgi:phosphatidylglycerophosphate synthase
MVAALRSDAGFIVAAVWGTVSDFLDGFLARRFGWRTPLGATLDLTADGAFFLASFWWLWRFGGLGGEWLLAALAFSVPQLCAQGLLLWKRRPVGSPGQVWNKMLGGYSYATVLLLAVGLPDWLVMPPLLVLELYANLLDLVFVVKRVQKEA